MPLSRVQKGVVGEFAVLAVAIVTGGGQLEAYVPAADNEGRDAELRRHLSRLAGIGLQVKMAFTTVKMYRQKSYVLIEVAIRRSRVQNDPRLWYLFGYYDTKRLALHDPVFLVPAPVLHKLARRRAGGKFVIMASLEPDSQDEWSKYRVRLKDLGKRLLEIIDEASLMASAGPIEVSGDAITIFRRTRRGARRQAKRAA